MGIRVVTRLLTAAVLSLALLLPVAAGAVEIHGFGGWVYTRTDGNAFLSGDEQGRWDRANMALNFAAEPADKLAVRAQLELLLGVGEELETELDFVFAEYTFSDKLVLMLGKVQQPFGIYTEVYDVGTIRPFFDLPQSIYGPAGILSEGVTGIRVKGDLVPAKGWDLTYDLYVGEIEAGFSQPWADLVTLDDFEETEMDVQDVLGGRLVLATPLPGLSFGLSAYSGVKDREVDGEESVRSTAVGAQLEYRAGPAAIVAEYASLDAGDAFSADGYYVEGSYMVTKQLQAAVRYDRGETDLSGFDLGEDDGLLTHEAVAIGLNWWFNNYMVVRLSYQQIDGLRFVDEGDSEADDNTTGVFQLGGHFSF